MEPRYLAVANSLGTYVVREYLHNAKLPERILYMGCVLKPHQTLRRNERQVTLDKRANAAMAIPERVYIPLEHNPEIRVSSS